MERIHRLTEISKTLHEDNVCEKFNEVLATCQLESDQTGEDTRTTQEWNDYHNHRENWKKSNGDDD